ncbi:glycosyl hydrolase catalytic core-domain-containing protein [Suillus plorans]|uniref:Glycosyl hydrolase catalytic core-domain-containing protein n=1 Tax=Suillus plorans TaxID=116603 RepID=A0A9P7AJY6_9AGAM|nr:glycosyl hydrolase catalytic core-domain-containing protein [Suillus plorans]KAG1790972.1 glycosyl hydrolase catalytic core-domain-containing protein [Suillus plorans]
MISHRGGRAIENHLQTTNRCDNLSSHPEHSNSEGVIRLVLPAHFSRMVNFTFTTSCVVVALASGSFAATKRGLAFADSDNTGDIAVADGTQVSWVYNWGSTAPSYLKNTDMTYIPMQWGEDNADNFMAEVQAQNAKTILGFNEPDLGSQSDITPMTAASLWVQYIQPLKAHGVRLGSPAVSSAPSGIPWLSQFFGNCTECTFDFIPIHWYGDGLDNFKDYVELFYDKFSSPVWVTEFASTSSNVNEVEDFCTNAIAYLDGQNWIEGYAWFALYRQESGSYYNLLDVNGQPNTLGDIYLHGTN